MKKTENEIQEFREKHPLIPEYAIPKVKNKKSPTNALTADIKQYVKSIGGHAIRINSMGTYNEKLGKYIKSGSDNGVSDLLICIKGKMICTELKLGRDKMRPEQILFQKQIETAGGRYLITSSLESFKQQLNQLIN